MTENVKYRKDRKDKIQQVQEMMEQARRLDAEHQTQGSKASAEALRDDPSKVLSDAPIHRTNALVSEQLDQNLAKVAKKPEEYGTKQDGTRVLVKTSGSGFDPGHQLPGHQAGVNLRNPAAANRVRKSTDEPMHIAQPKAYEKAIDDNEEQMAELRDKPTTGAVEELQARSPVAAAQVQGEEVTELRTEDTLEETETTDTTDTTPEPESKGRPFDPDKTNANFRFEESESLFHAYAAGAEVESGEVTFEDRGRTQTMGLGDERAAPSEPTRRITLDDLEQDES